MHRCLIRSAYCSKGIDKLVSLYGVGTSVKDGLEIEN